MESGEALRKNECWMGRRTSAIQVILWCYSLLALCVGYAIGVEQGVQKTVQLLSPTEYQIFQQDEVGRAMVGVRVKAAPGLDDLQVRFVMTGEGCGETTGWIDMDRLGGGR